MFMFGELSLQKCLLPLSQFGEFDCNSTANQFAVQSQRSLSAVSEESLWSLRRVTEHGKVVVKRFI